MANTINDTGGLTTRTGTPDSDTFTISTEFGQRTITDFDVNDDKLDLSAYGSALNLELTQKGADVIINTASFDNGHIILKKGEDL